MMDQSTKRRRGPVALLQGGAERGILRDQLTRHADPLRALAGQHEADLRPCIGADHTLSRGRPRRSA